MRTLKHVFATAALSGAVSMLAACQGQNPFSMQSNPSARYHVAAANRPYLSPADKSSAGLTEGTTDGKVSGCNGDKPSLVFNGLPAVPVVYGKKNIQFEIQIVDPNSSKTLAPDLNRFSFHANLAKGQLDASVAVDCEDQGSWVSDRTWQFDCSLDTNRIKNSENLKNSGKIAEAVFFATATSKCGELSSGPEASPAVRVQFPNDGKSPVAKTATAHVGASI